MSFVGGGAPAISGFAGNKVSKSGFAGRRRPKLTPKEKIAEHEEIAEQIKHKKDDIKKLIDDIDTTEDDIEDDDVIDEFADEILDKADLDDLELDDLAELISRRQLIDAIEAITDAERRDFVYNSLDEFGINPYQDEVDLEGITFDEARKALGDAIATEWNDVMDGFGKIADSFAADTQIFDDMEAYSDIVRSIISGDPKYLAEGVAERLGIEFDDEGNFDLRNTLSDNLSPIFGRLIRKKLVNPLVSKINQYMGTSIGETLVETEAMAESIAGTQEIKQFESLLARTAAETLGQEFGEGASLLFEGTAPMLGVVGALQAVGAITRIISSVLRKANISHNAYNEENHQWFGTKPQWDWLKYTGPLNDAISGTAELIGDIYDRQDYIQGLSPRQRYEQKRELHNFAFRIYEDVITQISKPSFNGSLNFSEILKEAREYGTVSNNRFFRLPAIELATDLKFFLQDIVDGEIHKETTLRPTTGDPIYRGIDTIDAEGMTVNEYVTAYNEQVLKDELQMYKDLRDKIDEASKDENVMNEEGEAIPDIEIEIQELQDMIERRSSKAFGDIISTQYHYSLPLGGQQKKKDQEDLANLQSTLEDLESEQRKRLQEGRDLASQEQKVRNTLEVLGIEGYVKSDAEYEAIYEDKLKEIAEQAVEAPLRFEAYQELKKKYGRSMSDDMLRKMSGYGQFRDSDLRFPITGTGSDTILSVIGMTEEDYIDRLEEEADLTFEDWYEDYLDNLPTL